MTKYKKRIYIPFRKVLFLIVFLSSQILGYSQLQYFLPDSNAYFSVSSYKFWFNGDTIIGDYQYKNVYLQIGDSIANFQKAQYYASVREDTIGEKIFCIQKDDGVERLLADFSAQANDTVSVYTFWPAGAMLIQLPIFSVDSVNIYGSYRKRINFEHEWPSSEDIHEKWIEGIGSTYGLFFPGSIMHSLEIDYPRLLCIYIDDILYYKNDYYPSCYWDFQTNSFQIQNHDFLIFPTLVQNELNIIPTSPIHDQYQFVISDTYGKFILKGQLANKINVPSLKQGLYFLSIYKNKTFIKTTKIIKQ